MNIEITVDELQQLQEAAQRHGACILATKTTDGEPVWLTATARPKRQRNHKAGAAIPNTAAPQ